MRIVMRVTLLLASFLILLLLASPCSAQSQTLYWQYTITNGTSTFGQWSVCAAGTITTSTSASLTNTLKRPGFSVTGITGQRVFTNSQGSTVQNIVGLLGNGNANLAADDTLYVDYPHVDANGIAYLLDSPVIYGNGVFQVSRIASESTSYVLLSPLLSITSLSSHTQPSLSPHFAL